MDDLERQIKDIAPIIKWKEIVPNRRGYKAFEATLVVPSNYRDLASSVPVNFYCNKFLASTKNDSPKVHFIMIPGGPGLPGSFLLGLIQGLLRQFASKPVAIYTIDHRGVGKSSPFVSPTKGWSAIKSHMGEIIAQAPFPLADFTIANGALDVGMLAEAIRREHPKGRIVIYGGSYGAVVAHQAVKLLPNTFHASVLQIAPGVRGTSMGTIRGLAENCAKDKHCQTLVGHGASATDIWKEMQAAIRDIIKIDVNPCTRQLASHLTIEFEQAGERGRVQILAMALRNMLLRALGSGYPSTNIHTAHFVLPFLLATKQCLYPQKYFKDVLEPILNLIPPRIRREGFGVTQTIPSVENPNGPKRQLNIFANIVLLTDLDYYGGPPLISTKNPDPSVDLSFSIATTRRYRQLFPYLHNYQFTDTLPLSTYKTSVYFLQSRLDFSTSNHPAYDLYQSISAPRKVFALWENYGHELFLDECVVQILNEACGFGKITNVEECIRKKNEETRPDWTLKKFPSMAQLWHHIQPRKWTLSSNNNVDMPPTLSTGSIKSREPSSIRPELRPTLSSPPILYDTITLSPYFWLAISVLFVILIDLAVYFLILKPRVSSSQSEAEESADVETSSFITYIS